MNGKIQKTHRADLPSDQSGCHCWCHLHCWVAINGYKSIYSTTTGKKTVFSVQSFICIEPGLVFTKLYKPRDKFKKRFRARARGAAQAESARPRRPKKGTLADRRYIQSRISPINVYKSIYITHKHRSQYCHLISLKAPGRHRPAFDRGTRNQQNIRTGSKVVLFGWISSEHMHTDFSGLS